MRDRIERREQRRMGRTRRRRRRIGQLHTGPLAGQPLQCGCRFTHVAGNGTVIVTKCVDGHEENVHGSRILLAMTRACQGDGRQRDRKAEREETGDACSGECHRWKSDMP